MIDQIRRCEMGHMAVSFDYFCRPVLGRFGNGTGHGRGRVAIAAASQGEQRRLDVDDAIGIVSSPVAKAV
jgi:hypothetical protein